MASGGAYRVRREHYKHNETPKILLPAPPRDATARTWLKMVLNVPVWSGVNVFKEYSILGLSITTIRFINACVCVRVCVCVLRGCVLGQCAHCLLQQSSVYVV